MDTYHTKFINHAIANKLFRILIVEDHIALREIMLETLRMQGYDVQGVESAEALSELPANTHFDIALLDLNLPGEDGFSLAARLRNAQPDMGIVILSAYHSLDEKVTGYRQGADIYLAKPIAIEELCAAIDALARRIALKTIQPVQDEPYFLDLKAHLLRTPSGVLELRYQEVDILCALALAPERSLESNQLLQKLHKTQDAYGKAQLEVMISRLRSRLREYFPEQNPIRAERGRGYRLSIELQII